eukprot:165524-Ditylum_brightwellii.AAC.1
MVDNLTAKQATITHAELPKHSPKHKQKMGIRQKQWDGPANRETITGLAPTRQSRGAPPPVQQ